MASPKTTTSAVVTVDKALAKRWKALDAAVQDARRSGAHAFDRLWESVAEIVEHDPPLYLAGGFATAKAFFASALGETERSARRNMRVAKYASPAEEERFGPTRLDAAIGWIEAKAGAPVKGRVPVDFEKLKIPVEVDGKTVQKGLAELTVEQILSATRKRLRENGKTAPKASPVVKAIQAALGRGALAKVTVRYAGGAVSLSGVPVAALKDLAKALAKVSLPDDV